MSSTFCRPIGAGRSPISQAGCTSRAFGMTSRVSLKNTVRSRGAPGAQDRQRLLISELQHRTRNLLAIVQSIGKQTLGKGGTYADFTTRLAALSRVQGLIGDTTEDGIDLGDLVRLELRAVGAADG